MVAQKSTEETALAVTESESTELAVSSAVAAVQAEVQAAIIVARNFPRDESQAFAKLMKSCARTTFADGVEYNFPRGGSRVCGPSVKLAREAARVWGNIRHGLQIIREDEESRQIRGFAWDLETNTKVEAEMEFKKLIYRKKDGWVKPDERDLRELTHKHAAILIRNCILQLVPPDLIEDAINESRATLRASDQQDPEAARKRLIVAFDGLGISPKMLARYLGHPVDETPPDQVEDLRGVFASIRDGNSKWTDYTQGEAEPEKASIDPEKLKGKGRAPIESKKTTAFLVEVYMREHDIAPKDANPALRKAGVIGEKESWAKVADDASWPDAKKALEALVKP